MPEICPKCGALNQKGRSTCIRCGAELEIALFAEMFGPPRLLKGRYATQRALKRGRELSLYHAIDTQAEPEQRSGHQPCLVHQLTLTSHDPDRRELLEYRFLKEATAWKTRQHPNILRILDADVVHHRLYLITEPIAGISLSSIIQDRRQPVAEQTLVHWAEQLCDALAYLHAQSPPLVLGCMSPSIIHVDSVGHVQLTEVGLIRYRRSGLLGPARGVPGYAAPEQRTGQVTPRSDLYTLGVILYQIITRHDPRERPLPPLHRHVANMAAPRGVWAGHGASHALDFSEPVIQAIARAYRRDPEKRFSSAIEMRRALRGHSPHELEAPVGASPQTTAQLPPFELREGQVATTLPELAQLCATHWDDGLLALINGRIVEWLTESAAEARLEQAVQRTIQAQEQIASALARTGATAAAQEIARNAAFAAWLQDMGAMGVQPTLQVRPTRFDFGVVGATIKAKSFLNIHNAGQGYLTGRVESHLPWLTIPDPVFGCRTGETAQVPVEARGRDLPPGESRAPQAIQVVSNGGNAWIACEATSSPPMLKVRPQALNYGPITPGASRVAYLEVANQGGGRLSGQVLSRAPYLRVRHPNFSCPTGASAQIAVELLSDRLPRRAIRIRRALAVDSDSGQAQVDVTWEWARPALELDTLGLDLGSVERGAQVKRILTLSNSGTADLVGKAHSQVDWLLVEPTEFRCAPGSSQTLTVTCNTHLLAGGSTVKAEAIAIEANTGTQILSASIEVLAPRLVVEPREINLGIIRDGEQAEETLIVGNRGSLPWEGHVRASVPWLTVEPPEIRCEPGHFMPVTVVVHPQALETGGEWHVPDAILIGEGNEAQEVAVHAALSRPQLTVERHSLDFGLIGRTDIETLPLEILNSGTGELEWRIETRGTWLEVLPTSGTCGTDERATVQVNAYALAVDGESGQAWLTVHSNGGRADLPASVALSSPSLAVEPLSLELESENYAAASKTVRIINRGVGNLQGTIAAQVPWLACEPETFECATGVSIQIQVQANPEGLREGTYESVDALHIESNGGNREVRASLTLKLTPKLHISPQVLRFEDAADTLHPTERSLQLENQGYRTLRVQVIPSEPWIVVNREEWTIKAGKRARVRVRLVDAPQDAPGHATGYIEIRTPGSCEYLAVQRADV